MPNENEDSNTAPVTFFPIETPSDFTNQPFLTYQQRVDNLHAQESALQARIDALKLEESKTYADVHDVPKPVPVPDVFLSTCNHCGGITYSASAIDNCPRCNKG